MRRASEPLVDSWELKERAMKVIGVSKAARLVLAAAGVGACLALGACGGSAKSTTSKSLLQSGGRTVGLSTPSAKCPASGGTMSIGLEDEPATFFHLSARADAAT